MYYKEWSNLLNGLIFLIREVCFTNILKEMWNTTYDSLSSFLAHYKSLEKANSLFSLLGLPLLTKKDIDLLIEFPNLGAIRDRIISSIDLRFSMLYDDPLAVFTALTHPFFKCNWIEDEEKKKVCKIQFKQLLSDTPDEVDFFLRDPETSIQMLDRYPAIKNLFIKYNTSISSSAPVERLFSQAALFLTVRRNRLSDVLREMLILLKMSLK
ncbi:hypothetical protein GHT06_019041 [Daphnia sinensis]|uniref:HAT C-terminal dimerisation domain-containing protein n=1 Tax=Daphnia sinensis TaxID=1820382 RepID=A0AAD5KKS1_9CRUS|nr:hypothetical protein GHT06_019041 [Daphnia sinensis]